MKILYQNIVYILFGLKMKTKYLLITPVYNEERNIRQVIECVIAQTITPVKWIIADDGSEDKTGEIVEKCQGKYDFIEYLKLKREAVKSYYSRRTEVFLLGYERGKHIEHDFVAALDGDLTFSNDYYENILREFDQNPQLGIASGIYNNEINGRIEKVIRSNISTPGGLQMFRRQCYEEIGGYHVMRYGGDDSIADIMARMHGWKTRSFPQYQTIHHRPTGTAGGKHILRARFYQGFTEYNLATHPVFMLAKSFRRIFLEKPYFFASMARLAGFIVSSLKNGQRDIPAEVTVYVRKEQLKRLFKWFTRVEY